MNGCDLDSARLKMRAGRAVGTEKSAVRLSTCAGTCRPQSRFSHASILGHFRAPNSWLLLRWKKVTFPLENSGYIICRDAPRADSNTLGRLQPTPSEGRQRWHYDTLSSPQLPPPALVLSDDFWPQGAVGAWAPPPHPPEPQDLPRDYGPDGAASGLSRSTPRRRQHGVGPPIRW